jgi:hypothetical protein
MLAPAPADTPTKCGSVHSGCNLASEQCRSDPEGTGERPRRDAAVVQLSLDAGLDPELHLAVGRVLAPLRDEGVLIVGSGLSFHNLRLIRSTRGHEPSREFDAWLQQTLVHASPDERTRRPAVAPDQTHECGPRGRDGFGFQVWSIPAPGVLGKKSTSSGIQPKWRARAH